MLGGRCFNNFLLLKPIQVSKLSLFIAFKNVLGVGSKQKKCRYWINSVFVLSMVKMACGLC